MDQLDKLKSLITEAEKVLQSLVKQWSLSLDSANFQTKSKEDFDKYVAAFEAEKLKFLIELSHAGRKINVYQVPENLKENYFGLSFVEISEPKPGKKILENSWEFISYVVPDYESFLSTVSKDRDALSKIRIIGDTKVSYYAPLENRVQFRNRSISETDNVSAEEEAKENGEAAEVVENEKTESAPAEESGDKEKEARLKLMADFDNYRKMTEKRLGTMQATASKGALMKVIEIIDDLDRVAQHDKTEGIQNIHEKLLHFLETEGATELEVRKGDKFDHETMNAVTTFSVKDEKLANTVYEVIQKGYKFKDSGELLRHAKVVVAKYSK